MTRLRKRGITVYVSCLTVVFLASIQFYLLGDITTKKNEMLLDDAPTLFEEANATTAKKTTAPFSFSACLILKDDNIILPEWLAYHYTVLPLDRLIVGVDTLSHTDPTPIFDAYQSIGMKITTWKNDSFWIDGVESWAKKEYSITNSTSYDDLRKRKRYRQNIFYEACFRKLQKEGRRWSLMIDVDEYLAFNFYDESEKKSSSDYNVTKNTRSEINESPPETMAEVVNHWNIDPKLPCVTFARYLFTSTETFGDNSTELPQQLLLHPDFNASLFHTLRYRQRAPLNGQQAGKSIIDASRYNGAPINNPHRIPKLCTGSNVFPNNKVMPFRVHHYVGSWEAFRSPGFDPRGRSYFDKRNNVKNTVTDSTMSAWLDRFTLLVGADKAIEMTQTLRLHAELEMKRKIEEQEQQQQYDWEKLNTKTKDWL